MSAADILKNCRRVAMVGASPNPERPSYHVLNYLKEHGYKVIPVNPSIAVVCGEKCYANLKDIPDKVDVGGYFQEVRGCPRHRG